MRSRFTMPAGLIRALPLAVTLASLTLSGVGAVPAEENGVALALVYDTSGSMREPVRTAEGKLAAKYVVGNRALEQIVRRMQHFATNSIPARVMHAGLFVFNGPSPREAVKFGLFDSAAMLHWIKGYAGPNGGTPLGVTLERAAHAVLQSTLSQKHVLVITDGLNTLGPDPGIIVPRIQKAAQTRESVVFIHFVAFDVDAKVFAPLKKLGVTVVGAADEAQLNHQLEFILEEKILLEKPEPKKP